MNPKKIDVPIYKLPKEEYKIGESLALENAENLYKLACSCIELNIPGNGLSILIISLEELSKAAYLQIKASDPAINVTELDRFFFDHKIKHKAIATLSAKWLNDNIPEKNQIFIAVAAVLILAAFIIASKGEVKLKGLEHVRQRGLYVTRNKETNIWDSPKELINDKTFQEWLDLSKKLFESVKDDLFSSKLTNKQTREYIEKLSDEKVFFSKVYSKNKQVQEQ